METTEVQETTKSSSIKTKAGEAASVVGKMVLTAALTLAVNKLVDAGWEKVFPSKTEEEPKS